jgi:hypothetical protein
VEDAVPDAKTLWLYREALTKAGVVEELFEMFDGLRKDKGYLAMGGQTIDATIVTAPKQHNRREENETITAGETPEDWKDKPNKNRQKASEEAALTVTVSKDQFFEAPCQCRFVFRPRTMEVKNIVRESLSGLQAISVS